jgi:hypothetical protein
MTSRRKKGQVGAIARMAKTAGMTYYGYIARCELGEKLCTHCMVWKPLAEFCRNRRLKRGRQSYCGECTRSYGLARRRIRRDQRLAREIANRSTPPVDVATPSVDAADVAMPTPKAVILVAMPDPRQLYREAMADPARQARFAAKRAELAAAVARADAAAAAMHQHWREQQRRRGRKANAALKGNRKPIAVGRGLHGGAA